MPTIPDCADCYDAYCNGEVVCDRHFAMIERDEGRRKQQAAVPNIYDSITDKPTDRIRGFAARCPSCGEDFAADTWLAIVRLCDEHLAAAGVLCAADAELEQ